MFSNSYGQDAITCERVVRGFIASATVIVTSKTGTVVDENR